MRLTLALIATAAFAQDVTFTVILTTPISTASSRKGDPVSAQVVAPAAFRGDLLQGHVTESRSGRGSSALNFNFDTLQHAGAAVAISSTITSLMNSQGQQDVDENGSPVASAAKSEASSAANSTARSAIGGLTGRMGGLGGTAANSGVNAVANVMQIEISSPAQRIQFNAGAQVSLSVRARAAGLNLASLPPNAAPSAGPTNVLNAGAQPSPSASAQLPAAGGGQQPNFTTARIDFIPGERTLFFDDFSDMVPDEPPPHWKIRDNPVELHMGQGFRELYAKDHVELTSPSFPGTPDFTFELDWTGQGETSWRFLSKENGNLLGVMVRGEPDGTTVNFSIEAEGSGTLGHGTVEHADLNQPIHFAVWMQRGRVRGYVNGQRLLDVNQVNLPAPDHILADIGGYRPNGIRSVRVAESAPDFSTLMGSSGRYVTHGIYFDTDSDRLRPESAPVIKMVANALLKNPNLRLEIDGYTDSTGNAQHNQELSTRRAEAVRAVLTSQFQIEPERLTSAGFGAGNPIGNNDTPEGRLQNRRVEFVKK